MKRFFDINAENHTAMAESARRPLYLHISLAGKSKGVTTIQEKRSGDARPFFLRVQALCEPAVRLFPARAGAHLFPFYCAVSARSFPSIGTTSFTEKFLPILNTPILPVARFSGAYFRRLKCDWYATSVMFDATK